MSKQTLLIMAVLALAALMFFCVRTHAPTLAAKLGVAAPAAAVASSALNPASLNALVANGKITLNGVLPDEAARKNVTTEAKKTFGEANVIDRTNIGSNIAAAGWLSALPQAFSAIKLLASGALNFNNGNVTIKAEVPTQNDKSALLQQFTASVGGNIRVNDQIIVTAAPAASLQNRLNDLLVNRVIEFETAADTLTAKGKAVLDEVLPLVRLSSQGEIEIAGHTDSRGSPVVNQELSQARAESVRDYLVANGVSSNRLKPVGYGAARPIADNSTSQGQKKNRRIEFSVKQ
ncbi:MAG: OmpA family protein [Burkholderiales bacterium]